jgi:hypothetical protein
LLSCFSFAELRHFSRFSGFPFYGHQAPCLPLSPLSLLAGATGFYNSVLPDFPVVHGYYLCEFLSFFISLVMSIQ